METEAISANIPVDQSTQQTNQSGQVKTQAFAKFDVTAYPFVTVNYTGGPSSNEDMEAYLEEFEALLIAARDLAASDESQQIRFIFELRSINFLQVLRHVGKQADFVKMIAETGLVHSIAGTAIIISSDLARRVVQMVLDMVTLQKPHKTFDVRESAKEWLKNL